MSGEQLQGMMKMQRDMLRSNPEMFRQIMESNPAMGNMSPEQVCGWVCAPAVCVDHDDLGERQRKRIG